MELLLAHHALLKAWDSKQIIIIIISICHPFQFLSREQYKSVKIRFKYNDEKNM
jgi:hypothetical protein